MKLSTAIILPILVFYLCFVLTITIFSRTPRKRMRYNLELFWTVKSIIAGRRELIREIFWNVVLFVPIGAMLAGLLSRKKAWLTTCLSVLIGVVMSAGIEVTQLLTHRGLFEFDDIIFNTVGAVFGAAVVGMVRRLGVKEDG